MKFKQFLINESKSYLGGRVGDILSAIHDLLENGKALGARQLTKNSEIIVNQIRKLLHGNWHNSEEKYLVYLQKVGVAIMRAIEEKGDLTDTLETSASALEDLLHKLGTPINSLGSQDETPQETPENEEEQSIDDGRSVGGPRQNDG